MRNKSSTSEVQNIDVIELYQGGLSTEKIALKFKVSASFIISVLRRHNIKLRSKSDARRQYTVNEKSFDTPLSPIASYFAGIMMTDGNIAIRKNGVTQCVVLPLTDLDVVEKFKEFMNYSGKITTSTYKNKGYLTRYCLNVTSTILVNSLINLGCTPNKTLTVCAHESLVSSRDFWRGCIDGDGSLEVDKRTGSRSISFATASEKFSNQFILFCKSYGIKITTRVRNNTNNPLYLSRTHGVGALNLARILYKDCCFAMARKLQRYREQYAVFPDD